jgi:cobalt-zinc-cadmium efflux system outer membrane protein
MQEVYIREDTEMDSGATNRLTQIGFVTAFFAVFAVISIVMVLLSSSSSLAGDLILKDLIDQGLKQSPDVLASQSRATAAEYKIPQAESLPDPMFMFGYQNEGFNGYTYGISKDAQWMFSASQMFPFPGKLSLKGEMAGWDAKSLSDSSEALKLKMVSRIKELYFDLFLAYKDIDIIRDKAGLFSAIEDAALARYASGMGTQEEVLMAQTEKYMLTEREEMLKQSIESLEAMINRTVGRDVDSPLGRPVETNATEYSYNLDQLVKAALDRSPEIRSKEKTITTNETKVKIAQKEYYPDVTLAANYFARGGNFLDMWSLTATINVPIFYKTKQDQGVHEATASLSEARHEFEATKLTVASALRDNRSIVTTAEKLMNLYREGLVPKSQQDVEAAMAGYVSGKVEAITVISRVNALLDTDFLYWKQFTEREKAIARIEALVGGF